MKKPNDYLFRLIKSMSMNEKRYFALFTKTFVPERGNKLQQLYKAIDKQKMYDEAVIKKKFAAEPYIGKRLNVAKKELFDLILRSLRNYTGENNIQLSILNKVQNAIILRSKSLYGINAEQLKKAEHLTVRYQYANIRHLVLYEMIRNMHGFRGVGISYEKMIQAYENLNSNLKSIEKIINTQHLTYTIVYNRAKGGTNRESNKSWEELSNNPLFYDIDEGASFEERIQQVELRTFYFHEINNVDALLKESYELVLMVERHPDILQDNYFDYVASFHQHIAFHLNYGITKGVSEKIEKLKTKITSPLKGFQLSKLMFKTITNEIRYLYYTGDYIKAIDIITGAAKIIKAMQPEKSENASALLLFFLYTAKIYFIAQEYKKALRQLNLIFNKPFYKYHAEIEETARMLQLMIYYERKDIDMLKNITKLLYKYYVDKQKQYGIEKIVLSYIKSNKRHSLERKYQLPNLKKLKQDLVDVTKNNLKEMAAEKRYGLIDWIESKIKHQPLWLVHKQKYAE